MKTLRAMMKWLAGLGLIWMLVACANTSAGLFGLGGTSWQEEVLLHDGTKVVVERSVELGGRHEIGQRPPYKEQSLGFTMPGSGRSIRWEDHYSKDIGTANFLPMLLDIRDGVAYLVASPMGCLSYNKWGRPNPPYVIFKYDTNDWQRIPLTELPEEIKSPNLIFSMPDFEVARSGKRFMTAEMIRAIIADYKQPEYKTILREPLPQQRINQMCMPMVHYKCGWFGTRPDGTFNKEFMDRICDK